MPRTASTARMRRLSRELEKVKNLVRRQFVFGLQSNLARARQLAAIKSFYRYLVRRKVIEVIERRKADEWRHSVVGYSLSYARLIELEVRLLEKEWMGEGGLFAKFRLR